MYIFFPQAHSKMTATTTHYWSLHPASGRLLVRRRLGAFLDIFYSPASSRFSHNRGREVYNDFQ